MNYVEGGGANESKACRTLDAKRANNIVTKKYQIGTKVGRFFFFEGGGAWKMSNMYLTS